MINSPIVKPIPDDKEPPYNIGDIMLDTQYNEYSIIVEVGIDRHDNIIYRHRDLADITRSWHTESWEMNQYYEVVS